MALSCSEDTLEYKIWTLLPAAQHVLGWLFKKNKQNTKEKLLLSRLFAGNLLQVFVDFFFVPKVADIAGIAFFVRRSRK